MANDAAAKLTTRVEGAALREINLDLGEISGVEYYIIGMSMFAMALFTTELIGLMLRMITAFGRISMTSSAIPLSLLMATRNTIAIYEIIFDTANVDSA